MIAHLIKDAKHIVVFSGAGMSTESGVPDFRSKNGIWNGKNPESLATVNAMKSNPNLFADFYRTRILGLKNIKPHPGYDCLTLLAKNYPFKAIITQNTDGLHEQAGNKGVIPLHGSLQKLHCHKCGKRYSTERYIEEELYCECGGFLRPSVVLFGETLEERMIELAQNEVNQADLFIVLGSSLVVSPANFFPMKAKENGAKLIIINHDPTPLDGLADIVIHNKKIGEVLINITEDLSLSFQKENDHEKK